MPSLVIVGSQWGDEGKGKLVDYLASNASWVVRFQVEIMLVIQLLLMEKLIN